MEKKNNYGEIFGAVLYNFFSLNNRDVYTIVKAHFLLKLSSNVYGKN